MTENSPVDCLVQRVSDYAEQHGLLPSDSELFVGFSGGADSTALLVFLRKMGFTPTAIHLHHHLRGGEADADAQWCEVFCQKQEIPFELHHLDPRGEQLPGESLEAVARRLRLDFWRKRSGISATVALAHHQDDALEDLFLRLGRGGNASSLTALRPVRRLCGVRIVRPLLSLRRHEVETFLESCGIRDWRRDSTNSDQQLRRNAIRHGLLPEFRRIFGNDTALTHALATLRHDADFLEENAENILAEANEPDWANLHPALLPRVLRAWLEEEIGGTVLLRRDAIERLRQELSRDTLGPTRIPLEADLTLILESGRLRVKKESPKLPPRDWNWKTNPTLPLPEIAAELHAYQNSEGSGEAFALAALPDTLTVRARQTGDRLIPFGSGSPKKLKEIFINAHIPREQRDAQPLLVAGDTIIWVAPLRRAEFGRLSGDEPFVRFQLLQPTSPATEAGK